jgi:hypothetical protein
MKRCERIWRVCGGALCVLLAGLAAPGCGRFARHSAPPIPVFLENPLLVMAPDPDFVWDQVVDAVDDFFKIEREERLRIIGGVLTEGRLDTFPTIGSTYFEPWRGDSTPGYERLHSTLQTIRRKATIRVTPAAGGYAVEVVVLKEVEDLYQPEQATVGGATLRHDGSVVRTEPRPGTAPKDLGWISLGRDTSLEQQILADIQSRLGVNPVLDPE